jgi:hypothetical protein
LAVRLQEMARRQHLDVYDGLYAVVDVVVVYVPGDDLFANVCDFSCDGFVDHGCMKTTAQWVCLKRGLAA